MKLIQILLFHVLQSVYHFITSCTQYVSSTSTVPIVTVVFKAEGPLLCLSHTPGDNAEATGEPRVTRRRGRHVSLNPLILVTICLYNVSSLHYLSRCRSQRWAWPVRMCMRLYGCESLFVPFVCGWVVVYSCVSPALSQAERDTGQRGPLCVTFTLVKPHSALFVSASACPCAC